MITYQSFAPKEDIKFSILIPTWNNLPYLKLCIKGLQQNAHFKHQIIVHINEGTDGTLEWVKNKMFDYSYSKENIGICLAVNAACSLAKTDYIVYMNDDMYACPNWDLHLWEEIKKINHHYFFFSATMIEPTETGNPCVLSPYNFGSSYDAFNENELLEKFDDLTFNDWQGSTWPPNLVHKKLWDLVGGFSIEFSPGMYSDPDFSMKLWHAGVRYFKGIGASRVYHFQSKSTGKAQMNDGKKQFLKKWGISASTFNKQILQRGLPFKGSLPDHKIKVGLKDKLKQLF